MKLCAGLLIIALVFTAATPVFAELYQYTDRNGNTVYTDSPPQNAESRKKELRQDGVYWSSRQDQRPASSAESAPSSAKQKPSDQPKKNYNRVTVVMYMTDW